MADAALVFACFGCCCGHRDRGGPKPPPRVLRRAAREAFTKSGLDGAARLSFTDCLGPCSEANVVFVYLDGRPLWFRRMNSRALFEELFAFVQNGLADADGALPAALAERSFSWTGGGIGPAPPVEPESP